MSALERVLERYNAALEPLKEFILPGGTRSAALCHVAHRLPARGAAAGAACIREANTSYSLQYLNRLSDLLFVLARVLNRRQGGADVLWQKNRGRKAEDQ